MCLDLFFLITGVGRGGSKESCTSIVTIEGFLLFQSDHEVVQGYLDNLDL